VGAKFAEKILNKEQWATKRGASFVMLALLRSPATQAAMKKELNPHVDEISKSEFPGSRQIVELLTGKPSPAPSTEAAAESTKRKKPEQQKEQSKKKQK
jgi:hypothetical protein